MLDFGTAILTLNVPITTKVVCFSRLLKCLRSHYGKQCGPRSDCSYRSSLFWVHADCFYTEFVSNVRQLFAADDFSSRHFSDAFLLSALRVKYFHCSWFLCLIWHSNIKMGYHPDSLESYLSEQRKSRVFTTIFVDSKTKLGVFPGLSGSLLGITVIMFVLL